MTCINLIPRHRVTARRTRMRAMMWAGALGFYGLALLGGAQLVAPPASVQAQQLERALDSAQQVIDRSREEHRKLRPTLAGVQRSLDTARSIGTHPDWSILLAVLANLREEDVVLETIELTTRPEAEPVKTGAAHAAKPEEGGAFQLTITGLGRSPGAVNSYALALEATGLFAGAVSQDAKPRTIGRSSASVFRITCTLKEAMPPPMPAGPPAFLSGSMGPPASLANPSAPPPRKEPAR